MDVLFDCEAAMINFFSLIFKICLGFKYLVYNENNSRKYQLKVILRKGLLETFYIL